MYENPKYKQATEQPRLEALRDQKDATEKQTISLSSSIVQGNQNPNAMEAYKSRPLHTLKNSGGRLDQQCLVDDKLLLSRSYSHWHDTNKPHNNTCHFQLSVEIPRRCLEGGNNFWSCHICPVQQNQI
jgi:hypothetical protein